MDGQQWGHGHRLWLVSPLGQRRSPRLAWGHTLSASAPLLPPSCGHQRADGGDSGSARGSGRWADPHQDSGSGHALEDCWPGREACPSPPQRTPVGKERFTDPQTQHCAGSGGHRPRGGRACASWPLLLQGLPPPLPHPQCREGGWRAASCRADGREKVRDGKQRIPAAAGRVLAAPAVTAAGGSELQLPLWPQDPAAPALTVRGPGTPTFTPQPRAHCSHPLPSAPQHPQALRPHQHSVTGEAGRERTQPPKPQVLPHQGFQHKASSAARLPAAVWPLTAGTGQCGHCGE
ncbi:hypothetical protein HJG60_011761 [Phyllostomus discolor]|uniref:Uncharacterized protein n=1 Tax=Phyllostomus discolor TaxID=89673 RepID=A0A833ZPC5_9CHIR|nr:hypothetical protein HJG60_011761 [Phyllostomus discolor]